MEWMSPFLSSTGRVLRGRVIVVLSAVGDEGGGVYSRFAGPMYVLTLISSNSCGSILPFRNESLLFIDYKRLLIERVVREFLNFHVREGCAWRSSPGRHCWRIAPSFVE